MPDKWPLANGNWSNAANWNGGTKPVPGDDVYADGRTVSIDENVNVASLRTTQRSGGTAGGVFTANNAGVLTINANIIAGTTAVLTRSGAPELLTVVGNVTGGSATNSFGLSMGNSTSIHLTGNATGGSGASSHGLALGNQSIATVIGNATGGTGLGATGINASSISSLVMTGNCTGGSVANANGLNMSGGNTVTVNGNASAGTGQSAQGIVSTTGTVVTLNGNVYGGTGTLLNAWGLQSGGSVTVNGHIYGGTSPNGFGTQIQPNGSLTVNGDAIPGNGSNCPAISTQASTTLTLNGTAFGNNFGDGIVVNLNPGVQSTAGTAYIRRVVSGTYGVFGVSGSFYIIDHAGTEIECREGPNGDTLTLVSAASVGDPPAVSDVREGVSYHYDTLTGTLAVPLPSQVLTGVGTDDTVGTWDLTTTELSNALLDALPSAISDILVPLVLEGLDSLSIVRLGPEYDPATRCITLIAGDDYLAATSNAITFAITLPGIDLTGSTARFAAASEYIGSLEGTATLIDTDTESPKVRLEWTKSQTAKPPDNRYKWAVRILDSSQRQQTIIGGPLILKPSPFTS